MGHHPACDRDCVHPDDLHIAIDGGKMECRCGCGCTIDRADYRHKQTCRGCRAILLSASKHGGPRAAEWAGWVNGYCPVCH